MGRQVFIDRFLEDPIAATPDNELTTGIRGRRNLVGGEVPEYTNLLAEAREQALDRMVRHAEEMGADGIVTFRLTTSTVMEGAAEILAYGTAVKLK